jgi:hypothetical protein
MSQREKTLPSAHHPNPSSRRSQHIRIGKSLQFPLREWKSAILTFVDGIQNRQQSVISSPEMIIGQARLRGQLNGRYMIAYGEKAIPPPNESLPEVREHMAHSDDSLARVDRLLRLFAASTAIAYVRINFPHNGVYWLWKTSDQLISATVLNLPRMIIF